MSDSTPSIGEPQDTFACPVRGDRSLDELVHQADFDDIHFFLEEALEEGLIDIEPADEDIDFALLPWEHPENAVDDEAFEQIEQAGYRHATLRDLINLAVERPNLQREYDIVALGTMRTRRIYDDKPGQTVWNHTDRDRSVCQWVTGLSNLKKKRVLIPVEIYLDKVLRKDTLVLVRNP